MKGNKLKSNAFILLIVVTHAFMMMGYSGYFHSPNDRNPETARNLLEEGQIAVLAREWTQTEVIFNESIDDAWGPKLAADTVGNVYIVWYDGLDYMGAGTDSDIFYRVWNATTGSWLPVEVVSFEHNGTSYIPVIAVDADGHVHVAWADNTNYNGSGGDYDVFYERWNATTGTWTKTVVVSNMSSGDSVRPQIAVDVHGNVHVVWQDITNYNGSGSDWDHFYRCWNATTDTWTMPQVVTTESTINSQQPALAVDSNGTVHVVWKESFGGHNNIFYKYLNGTTGVWSVAELITTESTGDTWNPEIAADREGDLHVVWDEESAYGNSGSDGDIFYKRRNATTGNWTTTELVSTESASHSITPTISIDGDGNLHVAWSDFITIVYKYWNATTGNWTSMEVVSTESTGITSKPTIAVDGTGCVHIAWEDKTNYMGAGTDYDIFYKKTIDIEIPNAPVLASISPNPDFDGIIELNWSEVVGATTYHVYRDTSSITLVIGMSPIGTSSTTNYTDRMTTSGIYYYVIVAGNASGNSSISNCERVVVILPFIIPGFAVLLGMVVIMALVFLQHRKKSAHLLDL